MMFAEAAVLGLVVLVTLLAALPQTRRDLGDLYGRLLASDAQDALTQLAIALREHGPGVGLSEAANRIRNIRRMRVACQVVEGFAPGAQEGLTALRAMLRAVSVILPLAPVRLLAWRTWTSRGVDGLVASARQVVISGIERLRLRVWLLGRAFVWSAGRLRRRAAAVTRDPRLWSQISSAVAELSVAGEETPATYERVVRSLDDVGKLLPAQPSRALGV